jgi:D-xylose transport system substrate-binding protein
MILTIRWPRRFRAVQWQTADLLKRLTCIATAGSLTLVMCGASMAAANIKIGVAMRTQTQPRWQFDVAAMEKKAKELGATLLIQWANDDATKQASQVDNLLSQGVKALIICSVDDKAAGALVKNAKVSNVPVIAYDIGIPNADVAYYLTRDNRKVGELQVNGALEFAPPDAQHPPNYALIKGDADNNVARDLANVYANVLKPLVDAGKVKIVADQWHAAWSGEAALKTAENALSAQNDNIQAFVTSNDSMAIGVAQAVKARNLTGKAYISGLDADVANDRLIVDGVITMSVWTKIDEMGARAIEAAVDLAQGKTPKQDGTLNNGMKDVPAAFIALEPVTAKNMCDWITHVAPPGWVTVKQVYVDVAPPPDCAGK